MSGLEAEFPAVRFVYMTGHLDGTGLQGNLHQRNEQIRAYCRSRRKGPVRLRRHRELRPGRHSTSATGSRTTRATTTANGDGKRDRNWATEWQQSHARRRGLVRVLVRSQPAAQREHEGLCGLVPLCATGRLGRVTPLGWGQVLHLSILRGLTPDRLKQRGHVSKMLRCSRSVTRGSPSTCPV